MFETLIERAGHIAERRAAARIAGLAEQMQGALPRGVTAEASAEGVRLLGRGLRRRFALEPALRWLRLR